MTRKHGSSQRGFTLIEVVVSMMLLAILSVMRCAVRSGSGRRL